MASRQKLLLPLAYKTYRLIRIVWVGRFYHISYGKQYGKNIFSIDSVYMRSSQNSQPNSDTSDVNSRKER